MFVVFFLSFVYCCIMLIFMGIERNDKVFCTLFKTAHQISQNLMALFHDDVIKLNHFPRYWPFVREINWSPVNSSHKGQWCGALMFSLICAWTNGWLSNRDTSDLRQFETPSCSLWRHCNVMLKEIDICRLVCQKQVLMTWISNYIPQNAPGYNYLFMLRKIHLKSQPLYLWLSELWIII